jgi:hypothetical protein
MLNQRAIAAQRLADQIAGLYRVAGQGCRGAASGRPGSLIRGNE